MKMSTESEATHVWRNNRGYYLYITPKNKVGVFVPNIHNASLGVEYTGADLTRVPVRITTTIQTIEK